MITNIPLRRRNYETIAISKTIAVYDQIESEALARIKLSRKNLLNFTNMC